MNANYYIVAHAPGTRLVWVR